MGINRERILLSLWNVSLSNV